MVRKLIKYDFMSFFRVLLPVQLIVIGIAAVNRFIQIFEQPDSIGYNITFWSSVVLLATACVVALVITMVIAIARFYQGLYSNEGYLSHTLPVTAGEHIISKVITSLIFEVGTCFAIFLAVCVATLGDVNIELFKAGAYLLKDGFQHFHGNFILYILEMILLLVVSEATSFLLYFFCISIGQLAKRKKILLAFGVFFGLYTLAQVVATVFLIFVTVFQDFFDDILLAINKFMELHLEASLHIILLGGTVFCLIFAFIFFIISRNIMKKRLNLT